MSTSVAWVRALIGLNERLPPGFEPDLRPDVVEHARTEPGTNQKIVQFLHPFAVRAVKLADRKPVALDMMHDPRLDHCRGRIGDAADDPAGRNVPCQKTGRIEAVELASVERPAMVLEVPPGHTVLHGHDHGAGRAQELDVARNLIQEMGLERQNHEIMASRFLGRRDGLDLGDMLRTVFPDQFKSIVLDRLEMSALVDDRNFVTGLRHLDR